MKKTFLAIAAICIAAGLTNCKKEDKTPSEVKDAQVVSTIQPGETVQEVVGDVVEAVDEGGQVVEEGVGEATQEVTPAPASGTSKTE